MDLIGKPWTEVAGRTDAELLANRVQAEAVMATDRRLMETGVTESIDEVIGSDDGQGRIWFSTKAPLRDESGTVNGLVGVSVEITERGRSEDNLRQMVNELNHRAKNILTTVQSITAQTLRDADPVARRNLVNRIMALSAVHMRWR